MKPQEQKISNGVNKKLLTFVFLIFGLLILTGCGQQSATADQAGNNQVKQVIDKVEVFDFHSTQRCVSCLTLGKYSGATVYEFFQPELRDGKIEFREINVDLPENRALANKFQARGSSLFINAIYGGQDHIQEDTQVWRLLGNEAQFKSYLRDKINNLLGK